MPEQQQKINPVLLLIIAAVIGYFVLARRADDKPTPPKPTAGATVVIVPPVGFGASMKLDEWAAKNNVEIRRYREDADVTKAEPEVRELFELTKGNRPCAITDLNGRIEILPLDESLLGRLDALK